MHFARMAFLRYYSSQLWGRQIPELGDRLSTATFGPGSTYAMPATYLEAYEDCISSLGHVV